MTNPSAGPHEELEECFIAHCQRTLCDHRGYAIASLRRHDETTRMWIELEP
jgi:hypothetical protein